MSEPQPVIRQGGRISFIWIVPILAAIIGLSMVIYTIQSQGPEVEIGFATAEGVEAGQTKVKLRSVEIGIVEAVDLGADLESVVVKARLHKNAKSLLRQSTQFWVVRPRIGAAGISGLGTLLSGVYIQIAPGDGPPSGGRYFEGLENPPVTPTGTPGLSFRLLSDSAGSVRSGSPILYEGFRVGRIETAEFDVSSRKMVYDAFIEAPYDDLVSTATRFWNASGISLRAKADGIEVDVASIESLVQGGVAMGLPKDVSPGDPVTSGEVYNLYASYDRVNEQPYRNNIDYVVEFSQSVRGLEPGAPVEFRGIPSGRVVRLLVGESVRDGSTSIPVLIRMEPGRITLPDTPDGAKQLGELLANLVSRGMRASLSTGNLLTGSLYVSLDMFPDEPDAEIGDFGGRPTLPTIETGLGGLERRVAQMLDKVNALPIESMLQQVDELLKGVNHALQQDEIQALPGSINATLNDLRGTLRSVSAGPLNSQLQQTLGELDRTLVSLRALVETLEGQPNAIFFNRDVGEDPRPPAGSQ